MRPHFGLGSAERIELVRITWPDGSCDEIGQDGLAGRINTTIDIEQGRGMRDSAAGMTADVAKQNTGAAER
jgi:hypothetical protein